MDNFVSIGFLLVMSFFLYTPTKRSMHMFQQNRYQPQRYITWLKQEVQIRRRAILFQFVCLLGVYGLFLVSHKDLPQILLLLLLMIYSYVFFKIEDMKEYRKPFVFTHRMQRMLAGFYIGYMLLLIVGIMQFTLELWILLIPFLYFLPWVYLVVISYVMKPIEEHIRNIYVQEAKNMLQERDNLCIVGITGSYGKTSTKTILHQLLEDRYYTLMTPKSYNNLMGITLTIREHLQNLHEIFLCEMGADHVHEIETLMDYIEPSIGIVTAVGPQHLKTFQSIGNILHEKMQVIEKLPMDGIGFINVDNAYIRNYTIQNTCRIIRYGLHHPCDYQCGKIEYGKTGTIFQILHHDESHTFQTKLLGEHNVLNITAAIAIAHTLKIGWRELQQLVMKLDYVKHRLEIREGRYTILDNAYNSNPEGAKYSLDVLKQMGGNRIIVTPGFLDLGEEAQKAHQSFGEQISTCADIAILVGEQQTKDIVIGLRNGHFPLSHIHIVKGIQEAFTLLETLADSNTIVLLENDLPDAFNH